MSTLKRTELVFISVDTYWNRPFVNGVIQLYEHCSLHFLLPGPMSTPPQQPRGITEDDEEEKECQKETLKDGEMLQKDSTVSPLTKTSSLRKDCELQEDAGKTRTGRGGTDGIVERSELTSTFLEAAPSGESHKHRQCQFDEGKMFL